jgi:hypothetical protein
MKKKTSSQFKTGIRNILHAAQTRLQNMYDEFADILDTDEDRLALQFNGHYSRRERRAQARLSGMRR